MELDNSTDELMSIRKTTLSVLLIIAFVLGFTFLCSTGALDDHEYWEQRNEWMQQMKEDGAWVMW